MATTQTQSQTLFDLFPIEILFQIFDYLSNNDIIYAFLLFDHRLNNILLQNQRYLNHLELPKTNFNFWKNILSLIGPLIKSIDITSVDTQFPLTYFSNLRSLIISSPHGFPDEELRRIVNSDIFPKLHSFQLQKIKVFHDIHNVYNDSISQDYLVEKVFNNHNSLETFHYLLETSPLQIRTHQYFQINFSLKSLTILLTDFNDIYTLLLYTPNLQYLYLKSEVPYHYVRLTKNIDVKLKKLSLELYPKQRLRCFGISRNEEIDLKRLIDFIQLFSSSLIYLLLDLSDLEIENGIDFPINGFELRQTLETMIKLEQFHLFASLATNISADVDILSTFNDQFWLDHKWSFGTNDRYLFTLPFHFNYLSDFHQAMNNFRTNNPEILANNQKLWHSIKAVELPIESKTDSNLLKDIQTKIPFLHTIQFSPLEHQSPDVLVNLEEKDLCLQTVTNAYLYGDTFENAQDWLIHILPNLKSLTVRSHRLPRIENEFIPILNNKIETLELVVKFSNDRFDALIKQSYIYFSNVQYVYIQVTEFHSIWKNKANILIEMLENLRNLKALLVYNLYRIKLNDNKWSDFVKNITRKHMFRVKTYERYVLFTKETFQNNNKKMKS